MREGDAESDAGVRQADVLVALRRRTLLYVPPVFVVSVLLLTAMTSYSHGTPTPWSVLGELWQESTEGDEEIFILLGLVLWTLSSSYALASVVTLGRRGGFAWLAGFVVAALVTPFGAGLERCWRPHGALGNSLLALVWTAAFAAAFGFHLRRLAARLRVPPN